MIGPVILLSTVLVGALTAYALLGGADYGGGLWDLLASGRTAQRQRDTIARAIGPVWEANHVWLILAIVIVFTGFPRVFAAVSTYLHVPLLVALVGIVLRGSAFVFRSYGSADLRQERHWGRVFAVASIVTPFCLGAIVGAITEGRLPVSTRASFAAVYVMPWLTPFALATGLFALSLFAYLAAVYLTVEARDAEERAAFRWRSLLSAVAVAALAAGVLMLAERDLRSALMTSAWALPLHVATGASAAAAFLLLWFERYTLARLAAAAQVTFILWGWALAQYPYAIRPHLRLVDAAAPPNVLVLLLQVLGVGAVVLIPSLLYLFGIFGPLGDQGSSKVR